MSLKYLNYAVTFQEVPDEVSLCINIANCPHHCDGCHSPELREDTGFPLLEDLPDLIKSHADQITCVCFMGEGRALTDDEDWDELIEAINIVREEGLKVCLYTGCDKDNEAMWNLCLNYLDYFKIGKYYKELGGLDSPITNQVFFAKTVTDNCVKYKNITSRFRKHYQESGS